jgi:predicted nucleic acid-binding protein
MTNALVDTTVVVHLLRRYKPALTWYGSQTEQLSIASPAWLEIMAGATSKANQTYAESLLKQFELLYCTTADQSWAMQQLKRFQFSHHIGANDCLIAAVAYRLQIPLYTHNLRDMTPLIGSLAIQPYA